MRLVDADAFEESARSRLDMQDLFLPIHIKEMVIDEMPTVEAVPIDWLEQMSEELTLKGNWKMAANIDLIIAVWTLNHMGVEEE